VNAPEQAARWVDTVWGERPGYFLFAFGHEGHFAPTGKYEFRHWTERHGEWPDDRDRFLVDALEKADECDVYVAPYLRSKPSRKKGSAIASSILYADVDELGPSLAGFERVLIGPGGLLVDSGNGRHPYLRLPEEAEPAELEQWNRWLARVLDADAGWAENKVLRLPGTFNHKDAGAGRHVPSGRDPRLPACAEGLDVRRVGPIPARVAGAEHERRGSDRPGDAVERARTAAGPH
jgi:hypothetical protein